ncbi:hypothetical protein CRG98_005217 [Punica granatum]|uniref:Uncharacterized protein n=1 Tax=Punica granatum TaxID=22663 RepID=A0A2I0L0T7_PUNGR|nr:hypothetical protein CRG98_005217 [Punica granatum]
MAVLVALLWLCSHGVDLCHQAKDDYEDEDGSFYESLLDRTMSNPSHCAGKHTDDYCCSAYLDWYREKPHRLGTGGSSICSSFCDSNAIPGRSISMLW